jgi:ATP-dependent DNA helicase RecQ
VPDLDSANALLRERFGFTRFRPGQAEVIAHLLGGRSSLAVFPTGSGKSLCYQLPALLLPGLTVVVSPLIALMKDQVDFLEKRGVAAARLDSSVSRDEFSRIQGALRDGTLKLLYVAPERFSNERFLARLKEIRVDLLVVDEAHCISEWGHNFRPDYLKLARFARELRVGRVLCLTATATPAVADDICRQFDIGPAAHVHTGFYRPNLFLRATACPPARRTALLIERLRSRPLGPTIVYVTLQKTAETVAAALADAGFAAEAYHAGMEAEAREAAQTRFMSATDRVVVATIAFGMGIDKADIRAVFHYNLPKSIENYAQEIGRAGRDGAPSHCEILAAGEDLTVLENFTLGDTPTPEALASFVRALFTGRSAGATFDVSGYDLSQAHDIRPLVVSTALTYLELDGTLAATAPFYTSYQWQFLRPAEDILARFDSARQDFLRALFAAAKSGRTWQSVELADAATALGCERERIVNALNFLDEKADLTLRAAGVRQGYRLLSPPADLARLATELAHRFAARERADLARSAAVEKLLSESGCLVRRLLSYFGEELGRDCGHCGSCSGDAAVPLVRPNKPLNLPIAEIANCRAQHPTALASARQISRLLCGLSSPALTRAKLTRHPLFGSLDTTPFARVLSAAEQIDR